MISTAPIAALIWENWRLTRVEAAQRAGLGILGGSAALLLLGNGATVAFWVILTLNAFFYMSIARLNGGRFLDGYRPGFPLYLLYTRPVSTFALVGVAVAYDAITAAALYLASAALLMLVFGEPFSLLPVALLIITLHLAYICIQWSTRSRVLQWIGSIVIFLPVFLALQERSKTAHQLELSPAEIAVLILVCVVSFVLTVAGVARQRRGEGFASAPLMRGSAGYPDWLFSLFRFACPTSSATRAQVWFELKSSGLPTLAIGVGIAVLTLLLFAIGIAVEFARPMAVTAVMLSAPAVLLLLGGNALGIRRRQGRAHASAFEVTQPYGTAQLVGLKLLVRTACVLIALIVVGVSAWESSALLGAWGSWFPEGGKDAVPELLKVRRNFGDAFAGLNGYVSAALGVIICVAVAATIAFLASFAALRARYPRPLRITGTALLCHGFALVLLALAEQAGIVPSALAEAAFEVTGWSLVIAMVLALLYIFWSGLAERALTAGYASIVIVISMAFGVAFLVMLSEAGLLAGLSAAGTVGMVWPVVLPMLAFLLAPWSLSRLRHA